METNIKKNVNKILNTIPLTIGVIVAVLAFLELGEASTLLGILGIGLFSSAVVELISD